MVKILEVKGLTKRFGGVVAVNNLSFAIEEATIVAIIGPNGAGKTTLFNLITGFAKPSTGRIIYKGIEITRYPPYRISSLGIVRTFQRIRLFENLTVMDNLLLAMPDRTGENLFEPIFRKNLIFNMEKRKKEEAMKILKIVGLEKKEDELVRNLSHGQKKLLEIAKVIAQKGELILLDEPTAGVFPETRQRILELFRELKEQGKTILFIEHDMRVVMKASDRVIVLNYGEKIADGSPKEIINNEKVIEAYLGRRRDIA